MRQFHSHPFADLFHQWLAGRTHDEEAVHEGIVDRPLEAVALDQWIGARGDARPPNHVRSGLPPFAIFGKVNDPGTI